ncbi:MAG: ferritin-like domain-containing protein [Planctomycetes bacterium]|nr:ferritin-like domain-containing protein [Planctomycetota bacterium]
MEIRRFAERVLLSRSLEEKLQRPEGPLTDEAPGEPLHVSVPGRPAELEFAPRRTAPRMPSAEALADPRKRGVAHHIMANHELQAAEVMAWVLCQFPDAPAEFRSGLVRILADEQRHTRMHAERAAALGVPFGSLPVNCYIWKKALAFGSVLDYVAGLPLVFEGRNLDHTLQFEEWFARVGDERGAAVFRGIHRDEIEHVRFGIEWLRRLKPPGMSDWEAWQTHLHWPLRAEKARGDTLHRDSRRAAGMSEDFLDRLDAAVGEV